MISVIPFPPGLSVREVAAPAAPADEILERIETIWDDEQKRRETGMTNGPIFSLARRDGPILSVWETQYKWWIAQRRDPALFGFLAVRPLAVSGILDLAEGLVFARRAHSNTQDAGLWELPPSGGVDNTSRRSGGIIAADAQILAELEEELGVPAQEVGTQPRAIAVMDDDTDHVVDIVFELRIAVSARELTARFAATTNREYTALRILPAGDAVALLAREGGELSSASAALLDYLRGNP